MIGWETEKHIERRANVKETTKKYNYPKSGPQAPKDVANLLKRDREDKDVIYVEPSC